MPNFQVDIFIISLYFMIQEIIIEFNVHLIDALTVKESLSFIFNKNIIIIILIKQYHA